MVIKGKIIAFREFGVCSRLFADFLFCWPQFLLPYFKCTNLNQCKNVELNYFWYVIVRMFDVKNIFWNISNVPRESKENDFLFLRNNQKSDGS